MSGQSRMKLSTRTLKHPQGRNHNYLTDSRNLVVCKYIPHEILGFLHFAVKIIHAYFVKVFLLPEAIASLHTCYCTCCRIWFVKIANVWTSAVTSHSLPHDDEYCYLGYQQLASHSECHQSSYFAL